MATIEVTLPVNDPAVPGEFQLDRGQLWAGLRRKAENAVPFVAGMSECTVLERTSDGLVREVVVNGERLREHVTFHPQQRVSFSRHDERATWLIHNEIREDASGALTLTFVSEVSPGGLTEDTAQDGQAVERIRASTLQVVQNTLDVIRRSAMHGASDLR